MVDDFEDVLEPYQSEIEEPIRREPPTQAPPLDNVSFIDLLESESGLGDFSNKLNPEMKSQVLVPLANLLDKYGFSEKIGSNPTTHAAFNVVSLLNDIAPVIKGLSDYVSGQRNALSAEDQQFLEEIAKAQQSGEFSDLFSNEDDVLEIGASEEEAVKRPVGTGLDDGPIDWYEMMGLVNPEKAAEMERKKRQEEMFGGMNAPKEKTVNSENYIESTKANLPTLEDLALAAGVTSEELDKSDSYKNPKDEGYSAESDIELGLVDILDDDIGLEILDKAINDNETIDFIEYDEEVEYDEEE